MTTSRKWALTIGAGLIVGLLALAGLVTAAFAQGPATPWQGWGGMMGSTSRGGWGGGMMGGWGRTPTGEVTVTPEQALAYAQTWLDTNTSAGLSTGLPGTTVADEADEFYGYYTTHTLQNG